MPEDAMRRRAIHLVPSTCHKALYNWFAAFFPHGKQKTYSYHNGLNQGHEIIGGDCPALDQYMLVNPCGDPRSV
jgi:hypothetical protein